MAPIPIEAAQSAFPRIFDGYGSGQLARQVRAFNDLVSAEEFSPHTPGWLAYRLTRVGIKKPHVALLNLLSLLGSDDVSTPPGAALAARIFLLETNLRDLLDRGIPTTTFRDMLRNPSGLDDLIAETDVACRLPRWGQLGAHNPTTKGGASNKNFDISWAWRRWRFNADVKWFETWVLKKGSGTSDLEALLHLVQALGAGEALDGRHLRALDLGGHDAARVHEASVQEHCARAAVAVVTPLLGAGEPDALTQCLEQAVAFVGEEAALVAVDRCCDDDLVGLDPVRHGTPAPTPGPARARRRDGAFAR